MKARRSYFSGEAAVQDFWPSFTDVMSTIVLILFFLMLLAYIQNIIYGNNLEYARKELAASISEIETAGQELKSIRKQIEDTKAQLSISQRRIEEQKAVIAANSKELDNLRGRLQSIALLRMDIMKKVKESVEKELGSYSSRGEELVSIGDNANIIINESLVFDYDSYKLKPEAKELLSELAKSLERVLEDSEIREYIDYISIEGHTDSLGSAQYNRELSARRATEVVNYLLISNPELERKYGRYFGANGFSEFRPVNTGTDEKSLAENRRIEISIVIKDSSIQELISKYLADSR